jgi:hypothetical protein
MHEGITGAKPIIIANEFARSASAFAHRMKALQLKVLPAARVCEHRARWLGQA